MRRARADRSGPNAVVAEQRAEGSAVSSPGEQRESQRAFSRSRWSENQHSAFAIDDRRGVHPGSLTFNCAHAMNAGSSITKRAPALCRTGSHWTPGSDPTLDGLRDSGPVHRPDPPAMRLDDLARNRQSKAGILSKPLTWPIRIEALEYPLQRVRGDAGTVVFDSNDHLLLGRFAVPRGCAPGEGDTNDHSRVRKMSRRCRSGSSRPAPDANRGPARNNPSWYVDPAAMELKVLSEPRCCAANPGTSTRRHAGALRRRPDQLRRAPAPHPAEKRRKCRRSVGRAAERHAA